jgi:hypothetical protein
MKNKTLYAILGIGAIAGVYFILKNKRNKRPIGISDDENVVFVNFSGKSVDKSNLLQGIEGALTNTISINEYEDFLKQSKVDKKYKRFLGKKFYTKQNNVNVRRGTYVNNGFFNNIAGTIPKAKSFVGKVVDVKLGDDKKLWFAVNEPNSNNKFEIKKEFSWDITKPIDYSLRWLRSDVVVVNMKNK